MNMWKYIITLLVAAFASKQAIASPTNNVVDRVSFISMTFSMLGDVLCVMTPIFLFGLLIYIITLLLERFFYRKYGLYNEKQNLTL